MEAISYAPDTCKPPALVARAVPASSWHGLAALALSSSSDSCCSSSSTSWPDSESGALAFLPAVAASGGLTEVCSGGTSRPAHLSQVPPVPPPPSFRCPLCGAAFARPQSLESHVRRTHMGAECVGCPHCGKCLSSSSSLKKHIRLHSGEAPFSCEFCQSAYRQKCELEKHLDSCHGDKELAGAEKPHLCDLCGHAFLYLSSCSGHRRGHSRCHQCDACGLRLGSASDLRRHVTSMHLPPAEWPHACPHCPDRRFTRGAHLRAHLASGRHAGAAAALRDDPDLLRCLMRDLEADGGGDVGEVPDLNLLDSVLTGDRLIDD